MMLYLGWMEEGCFLGGGMWRERSLRPVPFAESGESCRVSRGLNRSCGVV